ncbi:tannase/feruloyl esterase family alpha/beta hydrolase [Aquitalea sp. LB_tupeE]|nr:tannase/feruloyl esterase family alpha/beta hydrolase [Aquitalea sp. LB_tupeE]
MVAGWLSLLACVCLLCMGWLPGSVQAADYQPLPAQAAVISCAALGQQALTGVADAPVSIRAASVVSTPKGDFCKVEGNIAPAIGFEVDLPLKGWTQRYLQGGCGGLCGMTRVGISNAGRCGPALNGEFVVAGNDMGHKGPMMGPDQASFGADPQKRIDFAYRANHQTALVAKALIKAFYGQPARFSYFIGCSDGGREALMETQRYPDDFDGVAAGAPATLFQLQNSLYHGWNVVANQRADGSNILLQKRLGILHRAVLEHCAEGSGVKDGLLQDPLSCKVDPAWAQCPAGATDSSQCLSAEEVAVARKLYDGPLDAAGRKLTMGGVLPGSELQWMVPATAQGKSMSNDIASLAISYLILPQVDQAMGNLQQLRFDDASFAQLAQLAPLYNATNTNLQPFRQHGGKLILWHGLADTSVTPAVSLAYYQGVQQQLGAAATDSFMRLFLLPGVGHCGGGDGYDQVDVLAPLMAWTELQQPPAALLTGKLAHAAADFMAGPPPAGLPAEGKPAQAAPTLHAAPMPSSPLARPWGEVKATRPVYPWPLIARYRGQGDVNDAASYQAVPSALTLPLVFNSLASSLIGPDNQRNYRVENGRLTVLP